jgi:type IV pilus assembly protein PilM
MAALQSLTEKTPRAGNRRWPAVGGGKLWPQRHELLGVDFGSSLIKAVLLSRAEGEIALKQAVVSATPAGVVTSGEMTDALAVARTLRTLCKEHHLKTRQVAVAVAGEKVYAQLETLPTEFEEGLDEFIQDAIMKVVPYSIDRAAFDYERFPQGEAASKEVLWVSTGAEQVKWVREAVTLAGKVPAVVDAQACALANAYAFGCRPKHNEIAVLLHVGPRLMTMALLRGSMLLCSRDATLVRAHSGSEPGSLPELVVRELQQRWDGLLRHATPAEPHKLFLSGGAAKSPELREALQQVSGLAVEILNPFQSISLPPDSECGRLAAEHGPVFAVAVGLALRGFDDL